MKTTALALAIAAIAGIEIPSFAELLPGQLQLVLIAVAVVLAGAVALSLFRSDAPTPPADEGDRLSRYSRPRQLPLRRR